MNAEFGLTHVWTQGDTVTRVVFCTLLLMSLISWIVIVMKSIDLLRYKRQSRQVETFWHADDLTNGLQSLGDDPRNPYRAMVIEGREATAHHRARHEQVPTEEAQPGEAKSGQQHQGGDHHEATSTHSKLVHGQLTERSVQARVAPAPRTNRETSDSQAQSPQQPPQQPPEPLRTPRALQCTHHAQCQASQAQQQPGTAHLHSLQQAIRSIALLPGLQHALVPAGVLDGVPG